MLQQILEQAPLKRVPAGTQIFRQGDQCAQYFFVLEGSAKVFARSTNGKEVLLYRIEPESICLLTASCLLGNKAFPAEAIAETELKVRVINKTTFDLLMNESPEFRDKVLSGFGKRMNDLIATIQKLELESVEQRLVKFLLMQPLNIITTTHQQIADEIGSAREVVSRHLKRLEEQQLLKLGRGHITLTERAKLLALT